MCGFYCIAFIELVIAGKILLDYISLFSSNNYKCKPWLKAKKNI